MKTLVFHRGMSIGTPDGHQALAMLESQRRKEGRSIELVFVNATTDSQRKAAIGQQHDAVLDFRSWAEPIEDVRAWIKQYKQKFPGNPYGIIDYYAQTSSPHLPLVDAVDVYAKRSALINRKLYTQPLLGGYVFTDFLAKKMHFELNDWHFGAKIELDGAGKIMQIWNLGAINRYDRLAKLSRVSIPYRLRPIDINVRFGKVRRAEWMGWYQQYRGYCIDSLCSVSNTMRLSGNERVSSKRYLLELLNSKIVFSPFGWGEICFRDYEAVACGCLLLKQDMSHLETEPDIYRPMETYIPLHWDLSDLAEKIDWIRTNPKAASVIASRGRQALLEYFQRGGATHSLKRIIAKLSEAKQAICN